MNYFIPSIFGLSIVLSSIINILLNVIIGIENTQINTNILPYILFGYGLTKVRNILLLISVF